MTSAIANGDLLITQEKSNNNTTFTIRIKDNINHTTADFLIKCKQAFIALISKILSTRKIIKIYISYFSVQIENRLIYSEESIELSEVNHPVLYIGEDYWLNEHSNNLNEVIEKEINLIEDEIRKITNGAEVNPCTSEISVIVHDLDDELE